MKKQRIDKMFFNNNATKLTYTIGTTMYNYQVCPIVNLDSIDQIGATNIVDVRNLNDIISLVQPNPYAIEGLIKNDDVRNVMFIGLNAADKEAKTSFAPETRPQILLAAADMEDIFVVLKERIIRMDTLFQPVDIIATSNNPKGLFVINRNATKNKKVIVTLGTIVGEILIYKINDSSSLSIRKVDKQNIKAHTNNIECIAVNRDGTLVATASESGTRINIYSTDTYNLVNTFQRGSMKKTIYGLCFNWDSSYLACVCESGTIHYFDLVNDDNNPRSTIISYLSLFSSSVVSPKWSAYQFTISDLNSRVICEFSENNIFHVVTYDGRYFRVPPGKEKASDACMLQIN
jgi:hypothetical protein